MRHLQTIKAQTAAVEYFQPSPVPLKWRCSLQLAHYRERAGKGPAADLIGPVSTF